MTVSMLSAIVNRKHLPRFLAELSDNLFIVYFSGYISLLLGLLVVLSHNVWSADWRIFITLLGWIAVIKGLIRLFAPEKLPGMASKLFSEKGYFIIMAIFLLLGIYLTYVGFTPRL